MLEVELAWEPDFEAAFAELEKECADIVRGISVEAFKRVLYQTPQFFGRAVSSWSYSLNAPVFVDRSHMVDEAAIESDTANFTIRETKLGPVRAFYGLSKGHMVGVNNALEMNKGNEQGYQLGMTIFFSNGVDHEEGPYAAGLEDGSIRLRPINQPGAMASRAFDAMQAKYGHHSGVSAERAKVLKTFRIVEE